MNRLAQALFGSTVIAVSVIAAETNNTDSAARKCLKLYADGKFEALSKSSTQSGSFQFRLFASYLLYRRDPLRYRSNFIRALPRSKEQYTAYASIPSSLVVDQGTSIYEVSNKSVPWPISFWEIHSAAITLARQGNRICIRSILALSRFGDGEIGEGMSEEASHLFDTPAIVAKNWDLFQSHIDSLSSIRGDYPSAQVDKIKHDYAAAFSKDQRTLTRILHLIDKGDR